MRVALVFPRCRYPSGDPPLGVAYLAALAEEAGHEVTVVDTTFARDPGRLLQQALGKERFDLIGVSLMTVMVRDLRELLPLIKRLQPEARLVVGGPHATVEPLATLELPGVDIVALGEGEDTWRDLLAAGGNPEGLAGLWFRRGSEIIQNEPRAPLASLDSLPLPAWRLLDMKQYLASWFHLDAIGPNLSGTSIMASRGCPYSCSYCQPTLDRLFGKKLRWRSVEHVMRELYELKRLYNPRGLMWLDDTFTANPRWVKQFCEQLTASKLGYQWGCNVRADTVTRELLLVMREAGLTMVHLGIESGSQRVLDDIYRKGITLEQVTTAVEMAKSLGLYVRGYFMMGAPTETIEEIKATINLAASLELDDASFSLTTPFPHTFLWDFSSQYLAAGLEDFDYYKVPPYRAGYAVKPELLKKLRRYALLKFYFSRKRFARTLKSLGSPLALHRNLLKLRRF